MGRALLADPELPNKVASDRLEDITPCINCFGCRDDLWTNVLGIRCHVNATLGREAETKIIPSEKPGKVLVVGGGPAGMEAARVAAIRGHRVTLCEKASHLGGQLIQAATPPHKDSLGFLINYFQTQLRKLNVKVELNKKTTSAMVEEPNPDVLVIATGLNPFIPEIPGIDKAHVVQAGDVLEGKVEAGSQVVVIGGEMVGCETAEFLAEKGKKVTVTRRGPEMITKMGPSLKNFFLDRLQQKGVTLLTGVTYNQVTPEGLVITTREGKRETITADTIVLAAGSISNSQLYQELKGKMPEIHLAGDSVKPGTIRDAIADGFRIASQI